MAQALTTKRLKAKLDIVFSIYIRLRDADKNGYVKCYCCGKILHWKESQNMHFIPRQHMSTRFSEVNCHAGCVKCNYYNNGNIEAYALHLKKDFGSDIVERLTIQKAQTSHISTFEYEVLIKLYKEMSDKLRKEKGL